MAFLTDLTNKKCIAYNACMKARHIERKDTGGYMQTTQITKDTLATMSLDDLYAELARNELILCVNPNLAIRKIAKDALDMCIQGIADRMAKFKIGDLVIDGEYVIWQVTRISGKVLLSGVRVEYHGRRIKKNGAASAVESKIYRCPLRAANS